MSVDETTITLLSHGYLFAHFLITTFILAFSNLPACCFFFKSHGSIHSSMPFTLHAYYFTTTTIIPTFSINRKFWCCHKKKKLVGVTEKMEHLSLVYSIMNHSSPSWTSTPSDSVSGSDENNSCSFRKPAAMTRSRQLEEHGEFMEVGKVTEYGWHWQSPGSCWIWCRNLPVLLGYLVAGT